MFNSSSSGPSWLGNGPPKPPKHYAAWRIVAICDRTTLSRSGIVRPQALPGPAASVLTRLWCVLWCWMDNVGPYPNSRLSRSLRSSGFSRTGVSQHHTMAGGSVRGTVADGSDPPMAIGWSDRARVMALKTMSGWLRLRLQTWVLGGSGHCEWPETCVSGRRQESKGGTRRRMIKAFRWVCVERSLGSV